MGTAATGQSEAIEARRRVLGTLARATADELRSAIARLGPLPAVRDLRAPDVGMVMLRGRIGGDGAPFNAGEATVARAAVRVTDIGPGYGWRLGRDAEAARMAAILDALWQSADWRARIDAEVLAPLAERQDREREAAAAKAAATRVEFFTMARERP
jgi:alpha-D-ribose 1-methylphosphonate 5-triphosphate synthase subunit PhnG